MVEIQKDFLKVFAEFLNNNMFLGKKKYINKEYNMIWFIMKTIIMNVLDFVEYVLVVSVWPAGIGYKGLLM